MFWLFTLIGCSEKNNDFKVGVIVDKGGAQWESKVNAIKLAFEEYNSSVADDSNVKIIRFELFVLDSGESAENAMDITRSLVYEKHVNAIIGPNTTRAALPASVIAQNTEVAMISDGSTHPLTTLDKDFIFRVVPTDEQLVDAVISHIHESSNKKIALFYDKTNVYSRGAASLFRNKSEKSSFSIQLFEYTPNENSFEKFIEHEQQKFDAVILPNFVKDLEIQLQLLSNNQIATKIYILDTWDFKLQKLLHEKDQVIITGVTHPLLFSQSSKAQLFIEKYKARYGGTPDKSSAVSYDAANVLIRAVSKSKVEPKKSLKAHLFETNYDGLIGNIQFNKQGDLARGVSLYQITQNQVIEVSSNGSNKE